MLAKSDHSDSKNSPLGMKCHVNEVEILPFSKHQDSVSDQREHFKLMLQTYILQFTRTHTRGENIYY